MQKIYVKDRAISIGSWSGQIGPEKTGLVGFGLKAYTVLYSLQFLCLVRTGLDRTNRRWFV